MALSSTERKLFFSLWAVLILLGGLWFFRSSPAEKPVPIVTHLAPELRSLFSTATITKKDQHALTLELSVIPSPHERLVQLGYRFGKGATVLFRGEMAVSMPGNATLVSVSLANPKGLAFGEAALYLAR